MPELSHIDPGSAALLVLDYQIDALTKFMTAAQSADAITYVVDPISTARDAGMIVIHVVVARRPGHPEVSPRNPLFSVLKSNGMAVAEERRRRDPSGRCGSRGGTDRGQQRDATGVDTPRAPACRRRCAQQSLQVGVIEWAGSPGQRSGLSVGRRRDCCADPDPEVHAMLLDIVTAKQAAVVTTAQFASALPGRSS